MNTNTNTNTTTATRIEATKTVESNLIAGLTRSQIQARLDRAYGERATANADRIAGWDARIEVLTAALADAPRC